MKEMAEILGKETIDHYNTSDTRGTSQSYGLNYQKTGKELMSQDEIAFMDGGKCIMQFRGVRPFSPISLILQSISSTAFCPILTTRTP